MKWKNCVQSWQGRQLTTIRWHTREEPSQICSCAAAVDSVIPPTTRLSIAPCTHARVNRYLQPGLMHNIVFFFFHLHLFQTCVLSPDKLKIHTTPVCVFWMTFLCNSYVDSHSLPVRKAFIWALSGHNRHLDYMYMPVNIVTLYWWGGSVAEWLACWTQAQKSLGSNRSCKAVT